MSEKPEEYTNKNGIPGKRFRFEHWKKGKVLNTTSAGETVLEDKDTGEKRCEYLSIKEWELIQAEQKKIYGEKVEEQLKMMKVNFEKLLEEADKIDGRKRLINLEIEQFKYRFTPGYKKNSRYPVKVGVTELLWCRDLYPKLMRGEREYDHIHYRHYKYEEGGDRHEVQVDRFHIQVEAYIKYWNWLKVLPKSGKQLPVIEKLISKYKDAENKFCKNMPMDFPIEHFARLTTNNSGGDDNPYLTDDQFEAFIRRAFLKEKGIEKQTLNVGRGEKGHIVGAFYQFYQQSANHDSSHYKKAPYIRVLRDNFTNWTFDQITNFRYTSEKKWTNTT